jgi:uncharacterized membrane protein YuzA (DUF378 family)
MISLAVGLVIAVPVLVLGAILYNYATVNIEEVKRDWVNYRCNPVYMPFASDIYENFQYCTNTYAEAILGRALDPVHMMFSMFTGVIQTVLSQLDTFRGMIAGLQGFVMTFVSETFSKIGNVFGTFLQLMGRVRDITSRILGSTTYLLVISIAAINLIESMFNTLRSMVTSIVFIIFGLAFLILFLAPPLLVAMIPIGIAIGVSYSCFDPQTPIDLADGRTVPLYRIKVGDILSNNARVTATMRFATTERTELYTYKSILVAGNHLVRELGKWVYVRDSKLAVKYEGVRPREIICLNTTNHEICIDGVTFCDYEEVDSEPPDYTPLNPTDMVGDIELCRIQPGDRLGETQFVGVVHLEDGKMQVFTDSPDGTFKINGGEIVRDYPDTHDPTEFEAIQERVLSELNRRVVNNDEG